MKQIIIAFALAVPIFLAAAEFDLGDLANNKKIELFNRKLEPANAETPREIHLNAASGDGLAWIAGNGFAEGTIEVEVKGKNEQGRSFVGLAFHGKDDRTFDAVYLRPFNFQATETERRGHSIQYVSMPSHDWNELRTSHPGKYEAAITLAPDPNSWVKLKITVKGKNVSAFVNDSKTPSLQVDLLGDRHDGKLGLWVGNGSDGWFRNLKVYPPAN